MSGRKWPEFLGNQSIEGLRQIEQMAAVYGADEDYQLLMIGEAIGETLDRQRELLIRLEKRLQELEPDEATDETAA